MSNKNFYIIMTLIILFLLYGNQMEQKQDEKMRQQIFQLTETSTDLTGEFYKPSEKIKGIDNVQFTGFIDYKHFTMLSDNANLSYILEEGKIITLKDKKIAILSWNVQEDTIELVVLEK